MSRRASTRRRLAPRTRRARYLRTSLCVGIVRHGSARARTAGAVAQDRLIRSCDRLSARDDNTNNDIFIIFVDGKTVHLKEAGLTNAQLAELAALIGDVKGFNVKYECVVRT
jgi:hypothetical protein